MCRQVCSWNSAFFTLTDSSKKAESQNGMILPFSVLHEQTGHFFHLTCSSLSDMKEAHTFGLRNSLFMAFFSLQSSIERLRATAFLSKKVEILIFFFLFFFSSSRPVITFNCQKSAFLVSTQGTSKLFSEKYYWIFRFRTPELSSKFLFFFKFFFQFLSCSEF